ncbi:MAG: glycoside hydrolase family 5 protein [Paludibacteraceae bacterium]|nr:glycoside hydrolase family 5 protein [Paludibacteraceae bacterium]
MMAWGRIAEETLSVNALPEMTYPKGSPVDRWGKLCVARNAVGARVLCSQQGLPVQLRGMSSHGMQWAGVANLTQANLRLLSEDWKISVFRLAVYVDEEGGYAYNPTHRSRYVENVVKWCGENGIYCLIDWHTLTPGNPQHPKYRNRPDSGLDLAADFFAYCSRRFKNMKHILYEVCNEPNGVDYENERYGGVRWPDYQNPRVTWNEHIKPYCEDMLRIIRANDPDVVVVCGTPHWSQRTQDVIGNEPTDAEGRLYGNLLYAFHFYAASHNDGRHDETAVKFWDVNFMRYFSEGDPKDAVPCILAELPIFVTEWGTTDASGWTNFRPDLADGWLEILSGKNRGSQMVSWCNWSFSAEGGVCAALNWNSGNLEPMDERILTDSGKYVYHKLRELSGL